MLHTTEDIFLLVFSFAILRKWFGWVHGRHGCFAYLGGVIEVGGEFIIDRSPVERMIATGLAIGGNGGGGNIELYCE